MTMKIFYFLYFSTAVLLVQSTQNIIPVQNYPIYQQTYSGIPVTIPLSVQPVYNKPREEAFKVQNPINNQANLAPIICENINKILIKEVLSNPVLQTIFDPKTKIFNQYGMEISNQVPNYSTTPNIINNYFIVPPGCLKMKDKSKNVPVKAKNERKIQPTKIKNEKEVAKKTNSKSQRTLLKTVLTNDELTTNTKKNNNFINNKDIMEGVTNSKKKTRSRKNERLIDKSNVDLDIFKETNSQVDIYPITTSSIDINTKSKKRSNKKKSDSDGEDSLQINKNDNKTQGSKPTQTKTSVEPVKKDIKISTNNDDRSKNNDRVRAADKPTKTVRNTQQDQLMQHYKRQFPNIPDHTLKSMMSYMNNQYPNPLGLNYPNYLFPFNFDQMYQQPQIGKPNTNANKYKKKRRKTKNGKNSKKSKNNKKAKTVIKNVENTKVTSINKDTKFSMEEMQPAPNFVDSAMESLETLYQDITEVTTEAIDNYEEIYSQDEKVNVENSTTNNNTQNINGITSVNNVEFNNSAAVNHHEELFPIHNLEVNSDMHYNNNDEVLPVDNFDVIYEELSTKHDLEDTYNAAIIDNIQKEPNLEDKEEELHLPELGNEDVVPIIDENGLIEDYYPIFMDNAAYFANNQEYYVKDINDRHYYATDRNQKTDKRLERFANFIPLAALRDKLFNNIEQEIVEHIETIAPFKTKSITEDNPTEFRTPPALEFPGFVTKEVAKELKSEQDRPKFVEQKSSIYSNFKTPLFDRYIKPHIERRKVTTPKPQASAAVETVYAPSKVVKYGVSESNDPIESIQVGQSHKGDLLFVTAKSVDYTEPFW